MKKPIIGIVEWPYEDKDEDFIYEVFPQIVNSIIKSDGIPIGIFPIQDENFIKKRVSEIPNMTEIEEYNLKESLSLCDAIIKPGAIKIYNHERFIYRYTLNKNMPYLGICAGMQIMANNERDYICNDRNIDDSHKDTIHNINIFSYSKLFKIVKNNRILVKSRHNFHVPEETVINSNNLVTAIADDGIIEAIENPDCDFHMGLQWHPELLYDSNSKAIFNEFVSKAYEYSKKK